MAVSQETWVPWLPARLTGRARLVTDMKMAPFCNFHSSFSWLTYFGSLITDVDSSRIRWSRLPRSAIEVPLICPAQQLAEQLTACRLPSLTHRIALPFVNNLVTRELGCPPPRPNLSGSLKLSGIAAYNHLLNKDMKTPLTLQQTGLALIHKKTRIEPASGSGRITGTEKFQAHMSHLRSRLWRSPAASKRVRSRRHYCGNIDRDQWRIRR